MKRFRSSHSLTPLFCLHQAFFYFGITGISAFAVAYLVDKGFATAQVGFILAATNLLSCLLQPMLGSFVDKRSPALLPRMIIGFLTVSFASLFCVEMLRPSLAVTRVLYILGYLTYSVTLSLGNSMCAHYSQSGYRVDYGMGSGLGSLSFSFASLILGAVIARLGMRVMMLIAQMFIILQIVLVLFYPKISEEAGAAARQAGKAEASSLSIPAFFLRYRRFMLTMLGVALLAACHAMAENFLLQLFERIGGNSENVGVTLFLACVTAAVPTILFEKIQRKVPVTLLMRLSGLFYILKALLLIFASSVHAIYLIGLLQTFTYVFLFPSLYYFARARIAPADMVKGQTITSSTFSLGVALGNSLGGTMIDAAGLNAMLALAAALAAAGTLIVNLIIAKRDAA